MNGTLDAASVQRDFATVGHDKTGEQIEQGRLAGAVRTNKADYLSRAQFEVDLVGDNYAVEPAA